MVMLIVLNDDQVPGTSRDGEYVVSSPPSQRFVTKRQKRLPQKKDEDGEQKENSLGNRRASTRIQHKDRVVVVESDDSEDEKRKQKLKQKRRSMKLKKEEKVEEPATPMTNRERIKADNEKWLAEEAARKKAVETPSRVRFEVKDEESEDDKKKKIEESIFDRKGRRKSIMSSDIYSHEIKKNSAGKKVMPYKDIKEAKPHACDCRPATAIRLGKPRRSLSPRRTAVFTRRSRSANHSLNLPANRRILDDFPFKMARMTADINRERATLDHVSSPFSHEELQRRVAVMPEQRFTAWKEIREKRKRQLERAIRKGELPKDDAMLAELEKILLDGHLEDGYSVHGNGPVERVSRVESSRVRPSMDDDPFYYPWLSRRFEEEFNMQTLFYPSEENGGIRKWKSKVDNGDSRPTETFDIFENYFETIDRGTIRCRNPIKFCTRTPFSSPERVERVREQWREKYPITEGLPDIPCPSISHPDVVNENLEALRNQNEMTFNELHKNVNLQILDLFNQKRKADKKAPVKLSLVKREEEIEKEWKEALAKFNTKRRGGAEVQMAMADFKTMERKTHHEEKAIAHIVGLPWTPSQKYDDFDMYGSSNHINAGRMWSEVPRWFPRDSEKVRELLLPMVENGQALDHTLLHFAHKEEDFLAKNVMLMGADHVGLKHALLARFEFQLWEHERNKKRECEGLPPLSYFTPQPNNSFCEKEFNEQFGVCKEENLKPWLHYHPVLVLDPSRKEGSYMRLSVDRYKEPLPRGAVRVVVPSKERGVESDFEEICAAPFDINNEYLAMATGIVSFHPLHPEYKQNNDRTYKAVLSPAMLRDVWHKMCRGERQPTLNYGPSGQQPKEVKWPLNQVEFHLWFEAMKREWMKGDKKKPFSLRQADKEERHDHIQVEHPDLFVQLQKLLTDAAAKAATSTKTSKKTPKRQKCSGTSKGAQPKAARTTGETPTCAPVEKPAVAATTATTPKPTTLKRKLQGDEKKQQPDAVQKMARVTAPGTPRVRATTTVVGVKSAAIIKTVVPKELFCDDADQVEWMTPAVHKTLKRRLLAASGGTQTPRPTPSAVPSTSRPAAVATQSTPQAAAVEVSSPIVDLFTDKSNPWITPATVTIRKPRRIVSDATPSSGQSRDGGPVRVIPAGRAKARREPKAKISKTIPEENDDDL